MTVGDILLSHPWHYQITRYQGKFVVISGADSRVLYETTGLTDAKGAFEYARDQMTNAGKKTVIKAEGGFAEEFPISGKILLNSNDLYQNWEGMSGPRGTSTKLRVTANEPIFELTEGAGFNTFNNIYFTHNNALYSTGLIRFLDRTIGNGINGCRFHDFATYKGHCVSMEILGTGTGFSQYKNHINNCESNGFESFKNYSNQKVNVGADYFVSNNSVVNTDIYDAKYAMKIDAISGAQILLERWRNIAYQYNAANPLVGPDAVFKLDGGVGGQLWLWSFDDVITWDIPAGVNYANVPASTELMLINSIPSERIGGNATGIAKVKRLDWYTHARGTHNFAGVYNQRDYVITHGLGKAPKYVQVTVANNETNAILYCVAPKSLITTTQFTVRFLEPPPIPNRAGLLNLDLHWEVFL